MVLSWSALSGHGSPEAAEHSGQLVSSWPFPLRGTYVTERQAALVFQDVLCLKDTVQASNPECHLHPSVCLLSCIPRPLRTLWKPRPVPLAFSGVRIGGTVQSYAQRSSSPSLHWANV